MSGEVTLQLGVCSLLFVFFFGSEVREEELMLWQCIRKRIAAASFMSIAAINLARTCTVNGSRTM